MNPNRALLIQFFLIMGIAAGIEVDYSLNDIDIITQYDVDPSVAVYEEISGNPMTSEVHDYRVVSGPGRADLRQLFNSNGLLAESHTSGNGGSVSGGVVLTPSSLVITQQANIGGSFAQSSLTGSQSYMGGTAYTGQFAGTVSGVVSTVQSLSLGRSIYSGQSYQANGLFPLAFGYAAVDLSNANNPNIQGSFITDFAFGVGRISGQMGSEVVKSDVVECIDPVSYGSNVAGEGDQGAIIAAGAGNIQGLLASDPFSATFTLNGQGTLTGVGGFGADSSAYVDYIEAWTDGVKSASFAEGAEASGGQGAGIVSGAGSFYHEESTGSLPYPYYYFDNSLNGAASGAVGYGKKSSASAIFIGALTEGETSQAEGYELLANGNSWAGTGGAAGRLDWGAGIYPFMSYSYLDSEAAIIVDLALGKKSQASSGHILARTDGTGTFAAGSKLSANGPDYARAIAAAGDGIALNGGTLEVTNGAATGINAEKKAGVSADFMIAGTGNGAGSSGIGLQGSGDELAMTYSGAGDVLRFWADAFEVEGGSITGAGSQGKDGMVSANMLGSSLDVLGAESGGDGIWAVGKSSVAASAAGYSAILFDDHAIVGQGSLTGTASSGGDAGVQAALLQSSQGILSSSSEGAFLESHGKHASTASGAGQFVSLHSEGSSADQGSITGLAATGDARTFSLGLASSIDPTGSSSTGLGLSASGKKSAVMASGSGDVVTIESDEDLGRTRVEGGSITGAASFKNAAVGALLLSSGDILGADGSIGMGLGATGDKSAAMASGSGDVVTIRSDADRGRTRVVQGSITGATAFKKANVNSLLLTSGIAGGVDLSAGLLMQATGDKSASTASGSGELVVVRSNEDAGLARVEEGSITGAAGADSAAASSTLLASGGVSGGYGSIGLGLSSSGQKASALGSGSGSDMRIKADASEVSTTSGSAIGATAYGTDSRTSAGLIYDLVVAGIPILNHASGISAGGDDSASIAAGVSMNVYVRSDAGRGSFATGPGSIVGAAASGGSVVSAETLDISILSPTETPKATMISASGAKAVAASAVGASADIGSDTSTVNAGSIVGLAAENGGVSADSLGHSGLLPTGSNLMAYGSKAIEASATGLSTTMTAGQVSATAGSLAGAAAENGLVSADNLGSSGGLPIGSNLWAFGSKAIEASATGTSATMTTGQATVGVGSLVGAASEDGDVSASSLGSSGGLPSGSNLWAFGSKAIGASATGASATMTAGQTTVGVGSLVGAAAESGYVSAYGLGLSGGLPSGSILVADGSKAIEASATGLSATMTAGEVSVTAGSLVGAASVGGYVSAYGLGYSGLFPTGTNLRAFGSKSMAVSAASALGSISLKADRAIVNTGAIVGVSAEDGLVTAAGLSVNVNGPTGLTLHGEGSRSLAAAGAGGKVTIEPGGAKVESKILDPNGVLVALGAGGSSQVNAGSLEASKGLTTSTAIGSGLYAIGSTYSAIEVASSGAISESTIIDFQPASSGSPYYGITIPWGAYGGARTGDGSATASGTVMAKSEITSLVNTNYIIGGPGSTTSIKDHTQFQATGTSPVVFAGYKGLGAPTRTTKTDGGNYKIWAFKSLLSGNREVNNA